MNTSYLVHVVDDDAADRQSLAFLLMSAGYAVATHDSGPTFLSRMDGTDACVITDLRMPQVDGLALLAELKAKNARMPVIMITGQGDVHTAVSAMRNGAVDFLEKPFADHNLLQAVERACTRLSDGHGENSHPHDVTARLETLTNREQEVLQGVMDGLPNKLIAFKLGISVRTVEIHRGSMMAKLKARNLPDLVRMVVGLRQAPS